jgi:hypothetical protein
MSDAAFIAATDQHKAEFDRLVSESEDKLAVAIRQHDADYEPIIAARNAAELAHHHAHTEARLAYSAACELEWRAYHDRRIAATLDEG